MTDHDLSDADPGMLRGVKWAVLGINRPDPFQGGQGNPPKPGDGGDGGGPRVETYSGDCPNCDTTLVSVTLREGMEHVRGCQDVPWYGHTVMGVRPSLADRLYENLTGEEFGGVAHRQEDRIAYYWGRGDD